MADDLILDCPYYLLYRASLTVTARLKRELAEAGHGAVRPAYLGVLLCLWTEDGRQTGELARCAGLEPSTMTGLLDRMERDGLLRRSPDPDDRRAQRIHITPEGQRAREALDKVVTPLLDSMMADLSEAEVQSFKDTLRQVLANAER